MGADLDDEQFRERLAALSALPAELARGSYLDCPHPLDTALDALCALYLDASPAQRQRLVALVLPSVAMRRDTAVATGNLLTYIRRCGRRMAAPHDAELLRLGMTAAALAGGRADARDLAVALVFLRAAGTREGISHQVALEVLDETLPERLSSDESKTAQAERAARQVILGVWRSDGTTITRILAYHAGTG